MCVLNMSFFLLFVYVRSMEGVKTERKYGWVTREGGLSRVFFETKQKPPKWIFSLVRRTESMLGK